MEWSQNAGRSAPQTLTFGIEWEFLLPEDDPSTDESSGPNTSNASLLGQTHRLASDSLAPPELPNSSTSIEQSNSNQDIVNLRGGADDSSGDLSEIADPPDFFGGLPDPDQRDARIRAPEGGRWNEVIPLFADLLQVLVPFISHVNPQAIEPIPPAVYRDVATYWGMRLLRGRSVPASYFWTLRTDASVVESEVEARLADRWMGLELISRILIEGQTQEIRTVYAAIHRRFHIALNRRCGFHVHVSAGHLDLAGYKKLITIMWFAEEWLQRCCRRDRVDMNAGGPLSIAVLSHAAIEYRVGRSAPLPNPPVHPELEQLIPEGTSPAWVNMLRYIWSLDNLQGDDGLQEALCEPEGMEMSAPTERRCAFALRFDGDAWGNAADSVDYRQQPAAKDPTVEFRYSQATGNADRDIRFVNICIALVKAASWDNGRLRSLLAILAQRPQPWRFDGFLQALGLGEDVVFWNAEYLNLQGNAGAAQSLPSSDV